MIKTVGFALSVGMVIAAACNAAELGNIMPLGDSITRGSADPPIPGGYRERLYNRLKDAGHTFTFVGTQTDNGSPALEAAGQTHHEGHGSFTIANIDGHLNSYLSSIPAPNSVLLMIGTNDFIGGAGEDTAINRLDTLIGHITSRLPRANLIVSNLAVRGEDDVELRIQTLYNSRIPDLVRAHANSGEKVTFVDMHAVLTMSDLGVGDNCHPNQTGYDRMGDAWFEAIEKVPEPSAIVSLTAVFLGVVAYLRHMQR